MADIHIEREHRMDFTEARKTAALWVQQAEDKFNMRCTYVDGLERDEVSFTRAGVSGTLKVSQDKFEIDARLGFLLGAFKDRIQSEILKNLDTLLAQPVEAAHSGRSETL
ncbi:MAG: polyhydroxyalkanoic acid system family protein [Polaromonas sp.]